MKEDYYKTLIKDIIENNEKDEAIKIIANKLNEKQISNKKEMLTNLDKDKEIERLNNIINELEHDFKSYDLEYLRETYQGSLADFIETELKRIQELRIGVYYDKNN